ncbi:kelch repeat-containing protein, partial [Hyphomicrobium sp.]|uniref:Kelch repeat-containing protein n=1 Tax=Hyphomicrobium sp. TaxID=82 RepID=UPI001DE307A1|nr:hypothetical protein [Hyphomicrobium sp.]
MTTAQLSVKREAAATLGKNSGNRAVSLWLWFVALLVFAMVVVGGATPSGITAKAEQFNPATGKWKKLPDMLSARA